jgi:hypothetical protein
MVMNLWVPWKAVWNSAPQREWVGWLLHEPTDLWSMSSNTTRQALIFERNHAISILMKTMNHSLGTAYSDCCPYDTEVYSFLCSTLYKK